MTGAPHLDGDLWEVVGVSEAGRDVEPKVLAVLNHILTKTDVLQWREI